MEPPNSPESFDQVKQALLAGRKIEAIKLYREQTGVGLAEAKAAVEAMDFQKRDAAAAGALSSTDNPEAIRTALLAGNKIEAIKLYRMQHKVGLAEAKAAVEEMANRIRGGMPGESNLVKSGGCFGMVALVVLFFLAVWKSLA